MEVEMKLAKRIKRALRNGYEYYATNRALMPKTPQQIGGIATRGTLPSGYKLPQSVPVPVTHLYLIRST